MNDLPLAGRSAIVTGASRGYGLGIARVLAQRGAQVWLTGRTQGDLERVCAGIGPAAHPLVADVTSSADWDRVIAAVLAQCGRLDILVNNAGAGLSITDVVEQSDADAERTIAVNLLGTIYGCRRAAVAMIPRASGTIINVSSACAVKAWPQWANYSAAKGGVRQFSRCLYGELRTKGIRVTHLMPSWGNTEFLAAANLPGFPPEVRERCTQPEQLGAIVADLCAMPANLAVEEMTVWPLVQEVVPL